MQSDIENCEGWLSPRGLQFNSGWLPVFERAGGEELVGLSTPFADCMNHRYSYSAEVFTHLSDFVAKANTAVASGTKFNIT